MNRVIRVLSCIVYAAIVALIADPASAQAIVGGYVKVSEVRISRTVTEYVYRASLTNSGNALAGATATARSLSAATTIVDGNLTFGAVAAGATVMSGDTFTFRQDRAQSFDFSNIVWTVSAAASNRPPTADAGSDQRIPAAGTTVHLDGTGSTDPDGDPLSYAWTLVQVPPGSAATLSVPNASTPGFLADRKGTYIVSLTVNDGMVASAPDSSTIVVENTPPIANAGLDQSVHVGDLVTLTGAASTDADGDPLTYTWAFKTRPAGSSAVLQNPASLAPAFIADVAGTYEVRLVVNDGTSPSAADGVAISTINSAPVANAGADQIVTFGSVVTLDGSRSSDVDGDSLTFSWSLIQRPDGSAAVLDDVSAVKPTFTADRPGLYVARLVVNDGTVNSASDLAVITTGDVPPPVANAGSDQSVPVGTLVRLNGSGSTDVAGLPITYAWSLLSVPDGSAVALDSPTSVTPTFTIDRPGTYVAQLIVNDGLASSDPDTVSITTINSAPTANAGADQSVTAGQIVALDGTASSDPDGDALTYHWAFTSRPAGSAATLSNGMTAAPSFTADREGTYLVQLMVNDGAVSSPADTVTITTHNSTPLANAGADQFGLTIGAMVTLDGSGSSDADGQPLAYHWSLLSQPAGSTAALSSASAASPTFVPDAAGDYIAQLVVDDGFVNSPPDTVLIHVAGPVLATVAITPSDASASESGDPGMFTVSRSGDLASALTVFYTVSGSAVNGVDYGGLSGSVTIAAGAASAPIAVLPLADDVTEGDETVVATLDADPGYVTGAPFAAAVTIHDVPPAPLVSIVATDAIATEQGSDPGVFTIARATATASPLTVTFTRTGTASAATDYVDFPLTVTIPAGQLSTAVTVTPIPDPTAERRETVTLSLVDLAEYDLGSPSSATVLIGDEACVDGPALVNGALHCGDIAAAGQVDSWTFTATAGDRFAVHLGEIIDDNGFTPWLRVRQPNGTILESAWGNSATALANLVAPETGVYTVLVASDDTGFNGTGTYRLTLALTGHPVTVSVGDEGGPLTNGGVHRGAIVRGDVDVWTFDAIAGERLSVQLGELTDTNGGFTPWLRVWTPDGDPLSAVWGNSATQVGDIKAPLTGRYLVIVGSDDTGYDGTGTYRVTVLHSAANFTVSPGDEGGTLTNGAVHTGAISAGDVDVWTFDAVAGERLSVQLGELTDANGAFTPWLRIWTPDGELLGSSWGNAATQVGDKTIPVTGRYMVLVGSDDTGYDGVGTYRVTVLHSAADFTVSPGDEGGAFTNGAIHTGAISAGDVDVWTFDAIAGERISVQLGELTDATGTFTPWLRIWTPDGDLLGSSWGNAATQMGDKTAPLTGRYMVLVGSDDTGYDGTGTYRVTVLHSSADFRVSPGDEGGALTNGAIHTGAISAGDVDVWTFDAVAGERISVQLGELTDATGTFTPWLRIWTPDGDLLGSSWGNAATQVGDKTAPLTGRYMVLVGSDDTGYDGTGTYRVTVVHSGEAIAVSPGDEGGAVTLGAEHGGAIVRGDVDVWTFHAVAGERISVVMNEVTDPTGSFTPWIRIWTPTGDSAGATWGNTTAVVNNAVAPVTGTYMVLLGSDDTGYNGEGTYTVRVTAGP